MKPPWDPEGIIMGVFVTLVALCALATLAAHIIWQ